jgi:hypothetical protein
MTELTSAKQPERAEVAGPEPDDEGLGNIGPNEVAGPEPDDEGLGNIRQDVARVDSAG